MSYQACIRVHAFTGGTSSGCECKFGSKLMQAWGLKHNAVYQVESVGAHGPRAITVRVTAEISFHGNTIGYLTTLAWPFACLLWASFHSQVPGADGMPENSNAATHASMLQIMACTHWED